MASKEFYLTSFLTAESSGYSSTTYRNALSKSAESTSALAQFKKTSSASQVVATYQCSLADLPDNISHVKVTERSYVPSAARVTVKTVELLINDEVVYSRNMGTAYTAIYTMLDEDRSLSTEDTLKIRFKMTTTSTSDTLRVYGMTLTVEYEGSASNQLYVKRDGEWVAVKRIYKKNVNWIQQNMDASLFDENIKYVPMN